MTNDELAAALDRYAAEFAAAWDEITARIERGPLRKPVRTGFGGALVIADSHVVDGVRSVTLTEDSAPAIVDTWHTGDTTGDSVYVEIWDGPSHRRFHGYVDPTSRKLVQTG
jgi:hypothetical protein